MIWQYWQRWLASHLPRHATEAVLMRRRNTSSKVDSASGVFLVLPIDI